jgi:hypothetical protein
VDERKKSAQQGPASGGRRTASRIAGAPNFAAVFTPLRGASPTTKSAPPSPAGAAASRSWTRLARRRAKPHLSQDGGKKMSIEQQIEELRAELSWCDDAAERRQIEAELRAAERRWKRNNRAQREAEKASWQ